MKSLQYREFLALVLEANGPFSYICFGNRGMVDPVIYLSVQWPNGIPDRSFTIPA
jgi:hypothetical protein